MSPFWVSILAKIWESGRIPSRFGHRRPKEQHVDPRLVRPRVHFLDGLRRGVADRVLGCRNGFDEVALHERALHSSRQRGEHEACRDDDDECTAQPLTGGQPGGLQGSVAYDSDEQPDNADRGKNTRDDRQVTLVEGDGEQPLLRHQQVHRGQRRDTQRNRVRKNKPDRRRPAASRPDPGTNDPRAAKPRKRP